MEHARNGSDEERLEKGCVIGWRKGHRVHAEVIKGRHRWCRLDIRLGDEVKIW